MTKTFAIKTLLLATAAVTTLAAGPASARTRHHAAPRVEATQPYEPVVGSPYAANFANDPYVVTDGGRYLGRDPDIQIRSQLLKDESEYNGNN